MSDKKSMAIGPWSPNAAGNEEYKLRQEIATLTAELAAVKAERDAALKDQARLHHFATRIRGERLGAEQGFILPRIKPVTNIMQGSIIQHFYAAIDAEIAAREG